MLKNIQFKRPVVFFDLETTGTSVTNDRIVEICLIKIYPDGKEEKLTERINPEMPISPGASKIHGIYDEDVKDKPKFQELSAKIFSFFLGSDVGGYNIFGFDLPMIINEFERVGMQAPIDSSTKVLDPMRIYHKMEKRDLSAAYRFYCNKEIDNAHSAEDDILATIEVLNSQVLKYSLEKDVSSLDDFCRYENEKDTIDMDGKFRRDESGEVVFTFGTNRGKKVKENLGMLKWMLDKDFKEDTKEHARKLLEQFSKAKV